MITDQEAIEKAAEYLTSLSAKLKGGLLDRPERVKLESIERCGERWTVVLSYFAKTEKNKKPDWINVLEGVRRFKEFRFDESGNVVAMKDPTLA